MTDKPIEPPLEREIEMSDGIADARTGEDNAAANVDWRETLPAAEFCCWVVLLLAPMLRWINGAAVTDDQFYIQIGLVTLAFGGAISLRIWNWRRARRVQVARVGEEQR